MKSPEEIKEALQCRSNLWYCILHDCTYYRDKISMCSQNVARDALEYIQRLEDHVRDLAKKIEQLEAIQPKQSCLCDSYVCTYDFQYITWYFRSPEFCYKRCMEE